MWNRLSDCRTCSDSCHSFAEIHDRPRREEEEMDLLWRNWGRGLEFLASRSFV